MTNQVNPFMQQMSGAGFMMPQVQQPAGMMMPTPQPKQVMEEVSFDDDVKIVQLPKFSKMKTGETRRICFVHFTVTGAPLLKKSSQFTDQIAKTSFKPPEGATKQSQDLMEACVNKYGNPKQRFGTIVLSYQTDMHGTIIGPGFELQALLFGNDKWPLFQQIHREWGLSKVDILMHCTDETFQKVMVQPCRENTLNGANVPAEFRQKIYEDAALLYKNYLDAFMPKVKTEQEIYMLVTGMQAGQQQVAQNAFNPFAGQPMAAQGFNPAMGVSSPQMAGMAGQQGATTDFASMLAQGTQNTPVVGFGQQAATNTGFGQPQPQAGGFGQQPVQQPIQAAQQPTQTASQGVATAQPTQQVQAAQPEPVVSQVVQPQENAQPVANTQTVAASTVANPFVQTVAQ